jgi:hypothetical protein
MQWATSATAASAPWCARQAGFHILKVLEKREMGKAGIAVTGPRAAHPAASQRADDGPGAPELADFKRRIRPAKADLRGAGA